MQRRARMYLPELPCHVVQRGNDREACFIEPENYQFYLILWEELSPRYGFAHAYCLMTNHVHFLVTPGNETAVSNTMKVAGSRSRNLSPGATPRLLYWLHLPSRSCKLSVC